MIENLQHARDMPESAAWGPREATGQGVRTTCSQMYMRRGASRNIMKIFSLGMTVINLSSACEQRSSQSQCVAAVRGCVEAVWCVEAVVR